MKKIYSTNRKRWMRAVCMAFVLWMTGAGIASAQLPYVRSLFTAAYTPIAVATGATATTITGDDGVQAALPLGFTFNYLGTNYTTVDACSNGWISFASAGANAWTNANLFTATTPNNTVAPWWDDLNVGTGSVIYQTQGTAPNQTFTIQWTDVLSYNGGLRTLNFQVVLYETSNIIEFRYGSIGAGAFSTSESASIGIENGTGGAGNFLDCVSGSAFINQSYMTTHKWPLAFIRLTPGTPTAIPGGTYTVGTTGVFPNLSEAVANINHRGIAGPVTLSLTDAVYDTTLAGGANVFPLMLGPVTGNSSTNTITIQPASGTSTLRYRGVASGGGGNAANSTAYSTASEPILALVGTDYVTVRNLNLETSGNGLVDRGILVSNATALNGATNNLFENIGVTLLRTNTSTIAIQQNVNTTPTAATGANSNNTYRNLSISNTYNGINVASNAAFPDLALSIGTSSPTAFNSIGSATANDIGNGGNASYGINIANASGFSLFNNEIRNVTTTGTNQADGITISGTQATSSIYNNKVYNIRNTSTGSVVAVTGIRANVTATGTNDMRIYNNVISSITCGYTGAASATRSLRGIFVQTGGGGAATSTINVTSNSVSIDGSSNLNVSSAAYETGSATGPVINVRNNAFANFTIGQTAPAAHYAYVSPSAVAVGNTGSVSNNNNLYVFNTTQGFVGLGAATAYATLANWQAAYTQDANSVSCDPGYTNTLTDLHPSGVCMNNLGSPIAWVTTDLDNQARNGATPDIGAYEFTPNLLDAAAFSLVSPAAGACYSANETVTVQIKNNAAATLDFSVNPVTVTVNITGTATATLNTVVNTGTLAAGATQNVTVGTFNMSAAGTYVFNANTTLAGDQNNANDAMNQVTINYSPGANLPASRSICQGAGTNVTLTNTGATAPGSLQWQSSTDNGVTWVNETGPGNNTATYVVSPLDSTLYRILMCGTLATNIDSIFVISTTPPTTLGDTVCGLDTLHMSASGVGTMSWYTASTGGALVNTGNNYDVVLTVTDTFYVASGTGGGQSNIGLADNSAGGGQQTSTNYNTFDVASNCTLDGVYVYPGAAGNAILEVRDNLGNLVSGPYTLAVTAGQVGQRVYFPIGWNMVIGNGYRLQQGAGSVSMFRNASGVNYPYCTPGSEVCITGSAAGATFYYWAYDWQVSCGCASTRTQVIGVVNPATPIAISPLNPASCEDDSITFTASSANAGYNYTWNTLSGFGPNTNATYSGPAQAAQVVVTAVDGQGCVTRDTTNMTINAHPQGSLFGLDTLICIGETDSLWFLTPQASWADTNDVNVPDSDPAGATSVINVSGLPNSMSSTTLARVCFDMTTTFTADMDIFLISPNGTQVSLTQDAGGGGDNFTGTCFEMSAATTTAAGTAPFTGSFLPDGAGGFTNFAGGSPNGAWTLFMVDDAGGDLATLLNWSLRFNTPSISYDWTSSPAGFVDSVSSVLVSPIVPTTYYLTITDDSTGCDTTFSYFVDVNPPLSLTTNAPASVCPGATVSLVTAASGGNGVYSYDWNGLGTGNSLTVTVNSDTSFVVMVMDTCSTPMAYDTVQISVYPAMALTVTADTTICNGTSLTLDAMATGGDGNYQYMWSDGSTTSSITVNPTSTTTYSVTVTEGCGFTPATDQIVVTVNNAPVAGFNVNDLGSGNFTFTNTSTNATTYAWDFGDLNTSTQANPSHTYALNGTYIVTLIATNDCGSDTTTGTADFPISRDQLLNAANAQVFPNPNNGQFTLQLRGMSGTELKAEVSNVYGQVISVNTLNVMGNEYNVPFELKDVTKGVYFLKLSNETRSLTLRVTVQ